MINRSKLRFTLIIILFMVIIVVIAMTPRIVLTQDTDEDIDWSVKLCDSILARFTPATFGEWDYPQGLVLEGMWRVYERTGNTDYRDFIRDWVDRFVDDNGLNGVTLNKCDNFMPGVQLCHLYEEYPSESKYAVAAQQMRDSITNWPTAGGGLVHRLYDPWNTRLYLDGVFMFTVFLINYGAVFDDADYCNNKCVDQLLIYNDHLKYPATKLAWHAWDEAREAPWADPVTGLSPEVWCRALGWYVVCSIEVLEKLPTDHPDRQTIIDILVERLEGIKNYQDSTSGLWYQVVDKGNLTDNWVEESSGCLYTYAISKAIDAGYVSSADYYSTAKKGYEGILSNIELDATGKTQLYGICPGCGACVSYEVYIEQPQATNDDHGQGVFLFATEQQMMKYTDLRQLHQAENGTLYNAVTETTNRGFTGASYVNLDDEVGSYVEVTANSTANVTKTLVIRYANGLSEDIPMEIKVNGETISSSTSFAPTGAWSAWRGQTIDVPLTIGDNIIRLESITSTGGPNIDWLALDSTSGEIISLTITDYDNNGILFGVVNPGEPDSPADWGGSQGAVTITIGAETNVDVGVQLRGDDFSGPDTIDVSNVKYNDSDNLAGASTLTDAYVTWYTVEQPLTTDHVTQVYYWISIPAGKAPGPYTSTFFYRAFKLE
jgi:unsaturated rhamnogalacturonyl hydrolase